MFRFQQSFNRSTEVRHFGVVGLHMRALEKSKRPRELAKDAYGLYENFRPTIPPGVSGWGAAGELKLDLIKSLA